MPFTPTHILAVVPIGYLWSRSAPFSALVIGSLVPDWPLFTSVAPSYQTTHSFSGIFTACMPLGFALYLFFQIVLKRPLFELLPHPFRQRLQVFIKPPILFHPKTLVGVIIAIVVGALTHIVWDAFTHQGQWGLKVFPLLDTVILTIADLDIHGYKLLQYGSTAVGIPILLLCLRAWFRSSRPQPIPPSVLPQNIRIFLIALFILIPLALSMLTTAQLLTLPITYSVVHQVIFATVTQSGFVFFLLLGVYSILFYPLIKVQTWFLTL